jgi:transcriptional regulator with PAS, ATPase and Fis domain
MGESEMGLRILNLNSILKEVFQHYPFNVVTALALKFFFLNPYQRALIVDKEGRVQFLDPYSERALGLEPGGAKGLPVSVLLPDSSIPQVLKTGEPVVARLFKVGEKKMISAAYPLKVDGRLIGALGRILFNSVEELEKLYQNVQGLKHFSTGQRVAPPHLARYTFQDVVFASNEMRRVVEMAKRVSQIKTDVLIVGETGTGKEMLAHSIHNEGAKDTPFVRINCAAIPSELAESELFGYEKGSFTGALSSGKVGCFEAADGGTIFLDEVSCLSPAIQAKLLRTLQEREVVRIGSTRPRNLDFRVIAATNRDLRSMVDEGQFRADLYYRLAKVVIRIPPLRERKEDIPVYVDHFLKKISESFRLTGKTISEGAMDLLLRYPWPGNVRELINVLENAVINAWEGSQIQEEHLPDYVLSFLRKDEKDLHSPCCILERPYKIKDKLAQIERELIAGALKKFGGNRKKAADFLGVPRSTFYTKLKSYGII